jgi:hypothetical protein
MARRVSPLLVLVVAVVLAACQAQPTGPASSRTVLRDTDEPECVDTVYQQASATRTSVDSGSATPSSSSNACHVVVIWY